MTIDWGALGVVAVVSLVVGVGVVVLVSLALIGVVAVVSSLVIGRGGSGLPRVVLGATAPHTVAGTRT